MSDEIEKTMRKYQPNWQAATQKRRKSFLQNFVRYLLNHDVQAFLPGYDALRTAKVNFKTDAGK